MKELYKSHPRIFSAKCSVVGGFVVVIFFFILIWNFLDLLSICHLNQSLACWMERSVLIMLSMESSAFQWRFLTSRRENTIQIPKGTYSCVSLVSKTALIARNSERIETMFAISDLIRPESWNCTCHCKKKSCGRIPGESHSIRSIFLNMSATASSNFPARDDESFRKSYTSPRSSESLIRMSQAMEK